MEYSHILSYAQSEINLEQVAALINNGYRHTSPRSATLAGLSSTALCDESELGSPGEKRGRRTTHREIRSDETYDNDDEDLPPTKRRKSYEAPAVIAPRYFGTSPSFTSLEMDVTQPQADDGCLSSAVEYEQHHTLHIPRNSSMAPQECFSGKDEELDELALDDDSQQGNDVDGSDNSADEDYREHAVDKDEESTRPTKRRKIPSRPRHKALRRQHLTGFTIDKQLRTPRPSQSPSAINESQPAAEYRELAFKGSFKTVRIGAQTTFHLDFTLDDADDILEKVELLAAFKAINNRMSLQSPANIRASQSTMIPPKDQHETLRFPKKCNRWTVDEDTALKRMREEDGCSWKEISAALPRHPQNSIEVRYSNKFSNGARSRKRQRRRSGRD